MYRTQSWRDAFGLGLEEVADLIAYEKLTKDQKHDMWRAQAFGFEGPTALAFVVLTPEEQQRAYQAKLRLKGHSQKASEEMARTWTMPRDYYSRADEDVGDYWDATPANDD